MRHFGSKPRLNFSNRSSAIRYIPSLSFINFSIYQFWQKLKYLNDISEVYPFIDRHQIKVPEDYFSEGSATNGSVQKILPIFGRSLEEVMARRDHELLKVPIVIEKCCAYLKSSQGSC